MQAKKLICDNYELPAEEVCFTSAKTGEGVINLLHALITIPPPATSSTTLSI